MTDFPSPGKTTIEKLMKRILSITLDISFPRRKSNQVPKTTPGFVIDIDGVLYGENRSPPPDASKTIRYLQRNRIPFVFLTNRWRQTPHEGAAWIREVLEVDGIDPMQFIGGLSLFSTLVPKYEDELVLFVGVDLNRAKFLAEYFGFHRFSMSKDNYDAHPKDLLRFTAIFVFDEAKHPRKDAELITNILLAIRGTPQDNRFGIYWATEGLHFQKTLDENLSERAGCLLRKKYTFAKPSPENFHMAEMNLLGWHHHVNGAMAPKVGTIWMIGDNIVADIQGANLYRSVSTYSWESILVRTGLYKPGMLKYRPLIFWPTHISTGIWDAVQLAMRKEWRVRWWQRSRGRNTEEI